MPVALLFLALSAIIYKNTMEMFDFISVYQFYAIPFQIIIPLAVWIAAEIKARAKRKAAGGAASGA
jgi:spore germination protein KB